MRLWNKQSFAHVNHARIRSWNQPVLSNESKTSCSRKQRGPLMELELATDRYPPITSQTRYPLCHAASEDDLDTTDENWSQQNITSILRGVSLSNTTLIKETNSISIMILMNCMTNYWPLIVLCEDLPNNVESRLWRFGSSLTQSLYAWTQYIL